jgi:Family of unknown function (DUF5996)
MNEKNPAQSDWHPLRAVDKARLGEARLQAHYAVQWLARIARGYIPPQPDHSHTSLMWEHALGGFVTLALPNGARARLRLPTLTLAWHDGDSGGVPGSLDLSGHPDAFVRAWLGERCAAAGLDPQALDAPSPYAMPDHAIARGASYAAAGSADAMPTLAAWFANAELLLTPMQSRMIEHGLAASPVCVWPHHFDIAVLATLPEKSDGTTGSIGAGFSPGDDYYDEPYFYLSVYPEPDPATLPQLPTRGHWHTHEFTAAILTAGAFLAADDRKSETQAFLQAAFAIAHKALAHEALAHETLR